MSQPQPARLAFDDVVIDLAGRRVRRGGAEQPLEPKAFAVLALLASEPGRVFARDEILDAVWGHRHITPGVLNRVMTLLRHALGEDAQGARYLHTVHGVGYRFDLPEPTMPQVVAPPEAASPDIAAPSVSTASPPRRRETDRKGARSVWRNALWVLPVLVLLAAAGWKWWPRASSASPTVVEAPAPAAQRSIAVLPLTNASNDKEQQFFSDGLSESLINALSRSDGLKVIGRDSSFRFRDGKEDSASIGHKLGVSYLLSGSVQREGAVVRINTALTNTADGSTLWAEHYDRPYKDLFALQDEIAQGVANALQARLLPGAAAKLDDRPPSGNLAAYSAYLQGLQQWHEEHFDKAAGYFDEAVRLDPDYAMAWAQLSGSRSTVAAFDEQRPGVARELLRKSRFAADQALRLAPRLGPAHAARAYLQFYDFDYRGAWDECHRAVRLAPGDATVLNGCGFVLAGTGRLGEALRLRELLLSVEPLYTVNTFRYAELLMAVGRLDEAEQYLRAAEGMSQPRSAPSILRMFVAIARGDAKTARDVAGKQPAEWREMDLAIAAQGFPDRAAADAALEKAVAGKAWTEAHAYTIAQIYALRGDLDKTLEWLQRAPAGDLLFMLQNPLILRYRDDPRLIAFCAKIGLPSPTTSEALGIDRIRAANTGAR